MRKGWRIAVIVAAVLAAGLLVAGGLAARTVRRSFPQTDGSITLAGLDAPVEVFRDDYGIPHVYADTTHDLFFAQGYVHAQDRLWQMEFWRRVGQGRLSEVLGESTLSTDIFIRTVGWHRTAEAEVDMLDPAGREALEAYAEGVNAYIDTHARSQMGLEFSMLGLTGADWEIEPWTPVNTLTWAKAMAWELGGNMDFELERVDLMQRVGADMAADLFLPYRQGHPVAIPDASVIEALGADLEMAGGVDPGLNFASGSGDGLGSNDWAISGALTTTGAPLLANDPHLGIQMPSIWYEVGLHCNRRSPDCPYDVAGFSFAGAPGVIIGHNDNIAWGFTNTNPDVQDLYVERINPADPNRYEVDGEWLDAEVIREEIFVQGQDDPVVTYVRVTRNGPIISDLEPYEGRQGFFLDDEGQPVLTALAFRWTALEPGQTYQSILELNRAQDFGQFVAALANFEAPGQNIVYADTQGNIGLQVTGRVPIRANGDGTLPVPGWTDDYQWIGFIPYDEMPRVYNPPEGYVASANNAMVGDDYPYLITTEWDAGYRAQRIVDLIEAGQPISPERMAEIQRDTLSLSALEVMAALEGLSLDDPGAQEAARMLSGWDGHMDADSSQAALYALVWSELVRGTFYDELPEQLWPDGKTRTMDAVARLLDEPDNPWWDDVSTPARETRDDILASALAGGYALAVEQLGDDPARWAWGDLHTATFENQSLGQSGVGPIEALFNRGPFPTSGGTAIVDATSWQGHGDFRVVQVPSMRQIVNLADLDASQTVNTTGQSGHPYNPHYDDMLDLWLDGQYHPMLWDRAQVEAAAADHLTLEPR